MKAIYSIFGLAILITGATSCQKVIDVKLNSAAQKYVIEGGVNDAPGPYTVTISRTKDFSEDNTFEQIGGAQVIIEDVTAGNSDTLVETTAGTYKTTMMTGTPGHTYRLVVSVGGQNFTALSTMPAVAVAIDSLYAGRSQFGNPDEIYMTPVFTDPPGVGNYYRLRQWVRGVEIKSTRVRSDNTSDGRTYNTPLIYDASEDSDNPKIENGDSITAEVQCLNRQVYDYFRTLGDVTGENSATPANPLTNVTGGALGIFNTYTSRKRTVVAVF